LNFAGAGRVRTQNFNPRTTLVHTITRKVKPLFSKSIYRMFHHLCHSCRKQVNWEIISLHFQKTSENFYL